MRQELVNVDRYADYPKLIDYYKALNNELLFNLLKPMRDIPERNKKYREEELDNKLKIQNEIMYMNMNLEHLSKHNTYSYELEFFEEIDYKKTFSHNFKPNNMELFLVKEAKPIYSYDHIMIQSKQLNIKTFFNEENYYEIKNYNVNTKVEGENYVYAKYNNAYLTPNGLENSNIFNKRKNFRQSIKDLNQEQVKSITMFPNKYQDPNVQTKLQRFLKDYNLSKNKFEEVKRNYIKYIRTNSQLSSYQRKMGKTSYQNPLTQTIYYKIFVNNRTYYYIPDVQLLKYLIDRMNKNQVEERKKKFLNKLIRIISIQELLLKKQINHRLILNKVGLMQLFNTNIDKKIIYSRFSHNDIYFFKYLMEELKVNKEILIMRNPNVNTFKYSAIPIIKNKQSKTCLITYNGKNKLNFFVKQVTVEQFMPDLHILTDLLNTQYISQNENNYRKMIIADLLKLNNYKHIRTVYIVDNLTENDQGLYKAYNYVCKKENGLVVSSSKNENKKMMNLKKIVNQHRYRLKEIKEVFTKKHKQYNDFRIVSEMYNASIYALIKKDMKSKVIGEVLQDRLYQKLCKPLMNNKLLAIIYPLLMTILEDKFSTTTYKKNQYLVNKIQESLSIKERKLQMLIGDLNKYQEIDKQILIKSIEQNQIILKNRQEILQKNKLKPIKIMNGVNDLFQFSIKNLVDVKREKKNIFYNFKYQLNRFEMKQLLVFMTFKFNKYIVGDKALDLFNKLNFNVIEYDFKKDIRDNLLELYQNQDEALLKKNKNIKIDINYKKCTEYWKNYYYYEIDNIIKKNQ
jgi:hypothetical protein